VSYVGHRTPPKTDQRHNISQLSVQIVMRYHAGDLIASRDETSEKADAILTVPLPTTRLRDTRRQPRNWVSIFPTRP
jgi:hypothetical protein